MTAHEQEQTVKLARKIAHDLNSPLATLKMMMAVCTELPEDKRAVMNKALASIEQITNDLLADYKKPN